MRTRRDLARVLSIAAGAVALLVSAATPALAAPQRLGSDPEPGAELHAAPARVSIEFSEPLDDSSEIHVLDDCGNRLDGGDTTVNLNEMSVGVAKTPSGTYIVQYLAAGLTGSAQESFSFTVLHEGPTCDGSDPNEHDGHGGGNGNGNGNGHGGHGGGGNGGGDHEGHNGRTGDGTDHRRHDSMTGSGTHAGGNHDMGRGGHGQGHGKNKGQHGGGGTHGDHHQRNGNSSGDRETVAAGPGDAIPTDIPDGTTVLVALGLASVFGALGGWVLRVSGP